MLGQLAPIGGNEFDLYIDEDMLNEGNSLVDPGKAEYVAPSTPDQLLATDAGTERERLCTRPRQARIGTSTHCFTKTEATLFGVRKVVDTLLTPPSQHLGC